MLCKKCGAHIEDDAKECAFCGEKFLAVEPEPVAQEEEQPQEQRRSPMNGEIDIEI